LWLYEGSGTGAAWSQASQLRALPDKTTRVFRGFKSHRWIDVYYGRFAVFAKMAASHTDQLGIVDTLPEAKALAERTVVK
jgi:hypothetical protein